MWKLWVIYALVAAFLALGLVGIGCKPSVPSRQSNAVADFTSDVTEAEPQAPVHFTDLSSGDVEQWMWEFGDGYTSTSQNPTHSYDSPGTYTVALTVIAGPWSDTETKHGYIGIIGANQIPSYVTGQTRVIYEWARIPEGSALLEKVPCYCACKYLGHRHTRDCFWRDDGTFDRHGIACAPCIDIAEKTKQMHEQGKDICEIRKEIDLSYAAYAHLGTDTPMPEGCQS